MHGMYKAAAQHAEPLSMLAGAGAGAGAAAAAAAVQMYHASKESFLYIEEFYIGELLPSDKASVPLGGSQPPSHDFLQQLREFTTWRQAMQAQALARSKEASMFKSF
jgi:hypothetical protein